MSLYKQPFLEPYKGRGTRHTCPNCKVKKSFTLYLDGNTGEPIHPTVGICNRAIKCGYHYPPRQYFNDHKYNALPYSSSFSSQNSHSSISPHSSYNSHNSRNKPVSSPLQAHTVRLKVSQRKIDFIPLNYVKQSVSFNSNFVRFLCKHFSRDKIENAMRNYALGATKNQSVIFWQIDINGKVRTGKIMQYNPDTGKRVKNKTGAINWVHNILKKRNTKNGKSELANFNLCQCYFGEHLIRIYPDKPIAIVEAEKTAVIGSIIFDNYNWLAAGNLNGLNIEKSRILQNKNVVLYPDACCYERWVKKSIQIKSEIFCNIKTSHLIEKHATADQAEKGYDIADYIIEGF